MTSTRVLLIAAVLTACAVVLGVRVCHLRAEAQTQSIVVGILVDSAAVAAHPAVRQAYDQAFSEEGIAHEWLSAGDLALMSDAVVARRFAAILIPDTLDQHVPDGAVDRLANYARAGGNIAVIYDAGTRDERGAYLGRGAFEDLAGITYGRVDEAGNGAYTRGPLQFVSASAARSWHVPPGKLDASGAVTAYGYGKLDYPLASAQPAGTTGVIARTSTSIELAIRDAGKGLVLWAALPVGALAADGDELPLRWLLQAFVEDGARMPHIVAAPGGVGALVFNWHFDGIIDRPGAQLLLDKHLLRPDIRTEIDITAGPDEDKIGDGQGFDACGAGKSLVQSVARYANIGSHGGWAHNWFALNLAKGALSPAQVADDIHRNSACLASITGYPVRTYAAPVGVHPQPLVTNILESQGVDAYYYTGDNGGAPTLPLYHSSLVSSRVWAMPVMPNGTLASLGEMGSADVPPAAVSAWLNRTLDFIIRERTIRLVYSHPHDLVDYPRYIAVLSAFYDRVEASQRQNLVRTMDMQQAADFMTRVAATQLVMTRGADGMRISVSNPQGLRDVAIAVPAAWRRSTVMPASVSVVDDYQGWTVLALATDAKQTTLDFKGAK